MTGHLFFTLQEPSHHLSGGTLKEFLGDTISIDVIQRLGLTPFLSMDILAAPPWLCQAAVFAAALSSDCTVLALDEPFDGTAFDIFGPAALDLVAQACGNGRSIVIVTHHDAVASAAHRLIEIADQRVCKVTDR
jgi:predicted ABC-type transport system involved in lysophospholipase L1 biosynthesis ATPase subunit